MGVSSSSSSQYVDVKVFLYKYTPDFTLVNNQPNLQQVVNQLGQSETVEDTYQVTKYSIDFNAPRYFSKFDLTQYLKGYQFKQGLHEGTYEWTINLQDAIIPFEQLAPVATSTVRKTVTFISPNPRESAHAVVGPHCRTSSFAGLQEKDLVNLMAQYESEANYPNQVQAEVATITAAYLSRGTVTTPYASNSQGDSNSILNAPGSDIKFKNPQLNGIRLSDLVQKYNYMSIFVYKSSTSPKQAQQSIFPGGVVPGISGNVGHQVFNPSNEVHLMLSGYKNEFNGFVTSKNFSRVPGQVDQVNVTGQGSLRLFSDTKVLYNPGILLQGFYDAAILGATAPSTRLDVSSEVVSQYFSVFANLYQGKDPTEILRALLFLVYRISFNLLTTSSPGTVTSTSPALDTAGLISTNSLQEYWGFYDIYQLVLNQSGSVVSALDPSAATEVNKAGNLFTIAPFLLSLVMALRNYNYNIQHNLQVQLTQPTPPPLQPTGFGSTNNVVTPTPLPVPPPIDTVTDRPDKFFDVVDTANLNASKFAEEFGGPCVQISAVGKSFQPYFTMLKAGFDQYLSQFKSGHEIMGEVTLFSLLEFYERPNGRIILRTPQYNQPARIDTSEQEDRTGNSLTSKSIKVIQSSYSEDGTQMQTQRRGSWTTSLAGGIEPFHPAYGNGKLMMQYGFREAVTEANPVLEGVALKKASGTTSGGKVSSEQTADINNLVHKYLRFLMEYDNAGLRIGSLSVEGDPNLEVGKLFFDYTNNKMGYIVDVSKQLTIGDKYTSSIGLKFVRDINNAGTNFRLLPTLEELVSSSTKMIPGAQSTPIIQFPSVPTPTASGSNQAQIFSNLKSGLTTDPFPGAQ